jgi:orotate phosphoribosyltransferase
MVAIFTYGFPEAEQAFHEAGCSLRTLTHYPALLNKALEMQAITDEQIELLSQWNQSPKTWKAEHQA